MRNAVRRCAAIFAAAVMLAATLAGCGRDEGLPAVVTVGLPEEKSQGTGVFGDFKYTTYKTYVEITGYTGSALSVVMPDVIDTLRVMSIGKAAFSGAPIESVALPKSLRNIANYAFDGCKSLNKITFGGSLESIGDYAFRYVPAQSIEFPESLAYIGKYCFYGAGLVTLNIPSRVEKVGKYAFYGCESLASYTLPPRMTALADKMFNNCKSLTEVIIEDTVVSIGDYAYGGCDSLTAIYIPATVTDIGEGAFFNCPSLTIYTVAGSAAQKCAEKNGYRFELVTELPSKS